MVVEETILLVEDNPDDELLTRRTLKKNNICNEVVVAHDGAEALDYLFGTGRYEGRNLEDMPHVILLDLGLPKVGGWRS
jgi:two-component system response regulator